MMQAGGVNMIGENIKRYRIAALFTRKALALRLGMQGRSGEETIYKWETGKRPIPLKYFRPLHDIIGIPFEKLIP